MKLVFGAVCALMAAGAANAAISVVTNFDAIPNGNTVDSFHSRVGVFYQVDDWETVTGFGETSAPSLAFSRSGTGTVTTIFGFRKLSFTAGVFVPATVSVFSGPGGTGSLLASVSLDNPPFDPFAFYGTSLSWSGNAFSVVVSGGASQFGWDDVTFEVVPEPGTWAMMIAGFGLVGTGLRRRRMVAA